MSNETKKMALPKLRFPGFEDAGAWQETELGEVCRPQQWPTISSLHLVEKGYTVYGANGFIGYYSDYNHEHETVAVTCRGSTCGEVSLIPAKSYVTGNSMCLDDINPSKNSYVFVYNVLRNRGFKDVISGSAQPQIVGNAIRKIRFYLPKISEQQKVAAAFSSLDDLLTAQNAKLASLQAHKRGLMQGLFPAEGETVPKLRFPEFQDTEEWLSCPLKDVFTIFQGFAFSSTSSTSEGIRWLKIADVSIQRMSLDAPSFLPADYKETHKRYLVHRGDYVMALTRPILGDELKIAPVDNDFDGALLNQRVGKLLTSQNITFVYYLLQTSKVISNIKKSIAGSEPPNLSAYQIEDIETLIPAREEQQKIADCLSAVDYRITAQTQKIEALKLHKKGLMQVLFPAAAEPTA